MVRIPLVLSLYNRSFPSRADRYNQAGLIWEDQKGMSPNRTIPLFAVAIMLIAGAPSAIADDDRRDDNQHLQGSFVVAITLDLPGALPTSGLVTYSSEGTVIANEIVNFTGAPLAGATLTEDHGTWQRIGNGKFLVTFIKLASVGVVFVASVKSRAGVQSTGETFQGKFRVDVINPAGNLLFFVTGSITGKTHQSRAAVIGNYLISSISFSFALAA